MRRVIRAVRRRRTPRADARFANCAACAPVGRRRDAPVTRGGRARPRSNRRRRGRIGKDGIRLRNRPRLRRRRSGRPGDRCAARRPRISSHSWTSWSPPCPRWRTAGNRRAGARTRRRRRSRFPLSVRLPAISRASRRPRPRRSPRLFNADRASAFTRAFCRAGGVEVCLALTRAAALNEPGRGSNGDGIRGRKGKLKVTFAIPPSPSAGAGSSRRASGCSGGWSRGRGRGGRRHVGSRRTSRRSLPPPRADGVAHGERLTTPRCESRWTFWRKTARRRQLCRRLEHRRGRLRAGRFR